MECCYEVIQLSIWDVVSHEFSSRPLTSTQVMDEAPIDEAEAFIGFARRYMGPSDRLAPLPEPAPDVPFPNVGKTLTNHKAVLPPAPCKPALYRARYLQEQAATDAYNARYDVNGTMGAESAEFAKLKQALHVDPELLE